MRGHNIISTNLTRFNAYEKKRLESHLSNSPKELAGIKQLLK